MNLIRVDELKITKKKFVKEGEKEFLFKIGGQKERNT